VTAYDSEVKSTRYTRAATSVRDDFNIIHKTDMTIAFDSSADCPPPRLRNAFGVTARRIPMEPAP